MPALPPTPWLQPPDVAENYLKGYSLGQRNAGEINQMQIARERMAIESNEAQQRIGMAGQELKQRAEQNAMEMELKKKQLQQESLMQQQKLEIESYYRQSQLGVAKSRLEEASKLNQLKIEQAARQSAAKQSVDLEVQRDVGAGMDETEARMKAMFRHSADLFSGQGAAALGSKMQAFVPMDVQKTVPYLDPITGEPIKGVYGARTAGGAVVPHNMPSDNSDHVLENKSVDYALRQIARMQQDMKENLKGQARAKAEAPIVEHKRMVNEIYKKRGKEALFPDVEAAPMPSKKEDLEIGKTYQTSRGPAKWDGENFVKEQ